MSHQQIELVSRPMPMDKPENPLRIKSRLAALARTELMDAAPDDGLDRLTRLAKDILGSEVSLISFVEIDRQFFVSACGLSEPYTSNRQTPLSHSFCQHVVTTRKPLIVEDARTHDLVSSNLAVTDLNVISYLGMPLEYHGEVMGALCAINSSPKKWEHREIAFLKGLAELVEHEIDVRISLRRARELAQRSATIARDYHLRAKNNLAVFGALVALSGREASSVPDLVTKTNGRLSALAKAHDALLADVEKVKLHDLAKNLLTPYSAADHHAQIIGPEVVLSDEQVTPICLILHELATNSAKFGAFGSRGTVAISWELSSERLCSIEWKEAVALPMEHDSSVGFGSLLLKAATSQLGGTLESKWSSYGVQISLKFPVR